MRMSIKEKVGSFIDTFRELTTEQKNELVHKSNMAIRLSTLKTSDSYLKGYVPLIEDRRKELVDIICNLNLKDKHGESAIRIDELGKIAKKIEEVIDEGIKAGLQLEDINNNQKEIA